MGTNFFKIVLLLIATQFLFAGSCNKDGSRPCTMLTPYSFSATSEFSPQKEVYNIGDTIFLHSTIPKLLLNSITNQQVDYSNSTGIGGNCNFGILDTIDNLVKEGLSKFNVFPIIGSISPHNNSPNLGVNVSYKENLSSYDLRIGVQLKSRGLFSVGLTNLGSRGIRGQNCTNAGFDMTVTNDNKNLQLFEYAIGYPADAMLEKNIFFFRVQ